MAGFSDREETLREFLLNALEIQGITAEKTFFGLMVYLDGAGFKLVLREDD